MTLVLFALVVFLAFVVETAAGFGATVVTVTLAAQLLPISEVLAALVPVNLVLSAWLVVRNHRHVDASLLGRRVLPFMGAGLAAGMLATASRDEAWMKPAFATFVVALAIGELSRSRAAAPVAAPGPVASSVVLFGGGVIHGLFACGGPLAVYFLGRAVGDKARFRATLSALWLVLNAVLVGQFVARGLVSEASLARSGVLLGPLLAGLVAGEALHARLVERRFRVAVHLLLLAAGGALLVGSLGSVG